MEEYEKKKLGLKKYLTKLDASCKSRFGPLNKYIYPKKNPYKTYADADEYKKYILEGQTEKKHINNNTCKFVSNASSLDTNKDNQYFTEINNKRECELADGYWDPTSTNRANKYEDGVCWTTEQDQTCGEQLQNPELLRPYHGKYNKNIQKLVIENADRCNKTENCIWKQQTAYTYDCISGSKSPKDKPTGPVTVPPEEMPLDKFEEFLENWYFKNKNGPAPKVGTLLGRGDRCNGIDTEDGEGEEDKLAEAPSEIPEYIDYRPFNPTNLKDIILLKKKMTDKQFDTFKTVWTTRKKMGDKKWREYLGSHPDPLEEFYNRMDKEQFDTDYRVSAKVEVLKKQPMLPSIPQSVVNMVMKNIALKKSKKRGMLALHSTGSGKCHGINTPIMMHDGSIKKVQDIIVGDKLMGDDSKPREVLSLARGQDEIYDIIQDNGDAYTVNSEHILCLLNKTDNDILEIEVNDYIDLPQHLKHRLKGYKVSVNFPFESVQQNPYDIGYLSTHDLANISEDYIINSRQIRLHLLAGILDRHAKMINNIFYIISQSEKLIYLIRSLGFVVTLFDNAIIISGNIYLIPVRVLEKPERTDSVLTTNIKVEPLGRGNYYGFTLDGNNRYLLGDFTVTHNTCTATGVMDAFWDSDKQIIFASSVDAINSNPPFVFHKCAYNLFGRFQQSPYLGTSEAQSLALIGQAFKKRNVRFLSFAKLSNRVAKGIQYKKEHKITGGAPKKKKTIAPPAAPAAPSRKKKTIAPADPPAPGPAPGPAKPKKAEKTHAEILAGEEYVDLDNCILIIDEVHNLFRPLPNQKKQHEFLEKELIDPKKHPGLKVVILTATPGDNIPDLLKLLNIIRDYDVPEIPAPNTEDENSINTFKQNIRGMISFFDMSSDTTKFPTVKDSDPIKLPMSDNQFQRYIEAYKSIKDIQKNYKALAKKNELSKYYEPARKYANMLFNFEKDMDLNNFSSKLPYVLENIQKYADEKHYLYSAFYMRSGYGGHGVIAVSKELEKLGYEKLTVADAKKLNRAGKLPDPTIKRYILVINTELGEGGDSGQNLHELLKIYNHPANKDGQLIHIMLASNKYNESIDLKDVANIHMLEPFVTMASEKQAIGRAVRYCSFANKNRAKGEWVVKLHRYFMDKPSEILVDNTQQRQAIQSDILQIEIQIEEAGSKEALAEAKKQEKEIAKELAKQEKLALKGKQTGNIEQLRIDLTQATDKVTALTAALTDGKNIVADLKVKLREKAKELKKLDAPPKHTDTNIENIDERIYRESQERFKELFTIYQCLKEAACDCRLLKEFHSSTTGKDINCL